MVTLCSPRHKALSSNESDRILVFQQPVRASLSVCVGCATCGRKVISAHKQSEQVYKTGSTLNPRPSDLSEEEDLIHQCVVSDSNERMQHPLLISDSTRKNQCSERSATDLSCWRHCAHVHLGHVPESSLVDTGRLLDSLRFLATAIVPNLCLSGGSVNSNDLKISQTP